MPDLPVTEAAVEAACTSRLPGWPWPSSVSADNQRSLMRGSLSAALPHLLAGWAEDEALVERVATKFRRIKGLGDWDDDERRDLARHALRALGGDDG